VKEEFEKVQKLFIKQFTGNNVISQIIWSSKIVEDVFEAIDSTIEFFPEVLKDEEGNEIKQKFNIMLLGPGEVGKKYFNSNLGKSTIFKQLSFEKDEFKNYRGQDLATYYSNVVDSLDSIFRILMDSEDYLTKYNLIDRTEMQKLLLVKEETSLFQPLNDTQRDFVSNILKKMMNDKDFNEIVENHHKYLLSDSILYQFPNFESLVNRQGVMTKKDFLQ
jgi:hypothetical protein